MHGMRLSLPLFFLVLLLGGHTVERRSALASPSSGSMKPASLCTANERVVWSCETVEGRRLASLCSSKVLDGTRGYVQYRFGRAGAVELEFPRERVDTQRAFKYSRYTRPLVTYLKLEFTNNGFTYTIADDFNDEEKAPRRDAAITVTPAGASAKETRLRCRLPITGSLMKLEGVVVRVD